MIFTTSSIVAVNSVCAKMTKEQDFYRRGRNAQVNMIPKNATREQYSKATGLECLFGSLYLLGRRERINELFLLTMEEDHAL